MKCINVSHKLARKLKKYRIYMLVRYCLKFLTGQVAKILDSPVQHWTSDNPTVVECRRAQQRDGPSSSPNSKKTPPWVRSGNPFFLSLCRYLASITGWSYCAC